MRTYLPSLGRRFSYFISILSSILLLTAGISAYGQCPPIITATPAGASVCMGDSVALSCQPSTGTTWQWYRDGGPIAGATASSYYAKIDGTYTVIVGSCVLPSNPISVVMKPLPFITINVNSNDTLCNGQQVNLSISTGPNVQWVYLQPPGLLGQSTSPYIGVLNNTTTYQVVAVDQITTCASTATVTIPVAPTILPGTISSNDTVCVGGVPDLITGTPATGGNGTYSYQWQISTISAIAGFNDIPGATGLNYQPGACVVDTWFRRRVSSPPCPDMLSNSVMIRVIPTPFVAGSLTRTICSGSSVNYVPFSNVAGSTFAWTATVTGGTVIGVVASGTGNINTVLSLPVGSTNIGEVTYHIIPTSPAPYSCPGTPADLVVTILPTPIVTNAVMSQDICAGTTSTPVVFTSNVSGATFSWTSVASAGLSGFQATGTGDLPAMQIFSTRMTVGTVTYTVTPTGPAPDFCPGTPAVYVINVNPSPTVTNSPMDQTICSGQTTSAVNLTSNVGGTTFTWTATAVPPSLTGFQVSGTNTIPAQTIFNNTTAQGVVTYNIIPSGNINGCVGIPRNYYVYVEPIPAVVATPSSQTICSGMTTGISLTSGVSGATFSWTASAPSSILGFSNGSGNSITQTLTNTSNAPHDVTYVVTPTANGCTGNSITVVITVVPAATLTVSPLNQSTCSGAPIVINLTANYVGVTFTWTATATGNVTGYSNGAGSTISQTLINNDNVPRDVVYGVMLTFNGCTVGPQNITVTVYPTPQVTNNPLTATRCSGSAFVTSLTSSVAGTTFTYTANGTPGISGFANGSGNTINQTLVNSGNTPGSVTYTITPTANGCIGSPVNFIVTVNPIPDVNLSLTNQSICSATSTTPVILTSSVAGTTYSWTATPSAGGITGYTPSGTGNIPAQTINSSLSIQGNVTYTVVPSNSGCTGASKSHVVTINPLPLVTNASLSQSICSGATSTNVNLVSNVAGTSFTWIATPSGASISGYQPSGTNTIPAQTITNSSTSAGTVTYLITPTSNFGPACNGIGASYVTTINPVPTITSPLSSSVCSGQLFNYLATANLTGTTFQWTRAAVPGISNPASGGSSASINETLINLTATDINVTYVIQPYGPAPTLCAGVPQNLVVTVRALPQVNAGTDMTIAYGTSTTISGSASGGTGSLSYSWTPLTYIASGATTATPTTTNLYSDRTYVMNVTDASGCVNSDQMTVFITGSAISAAPTATPGSICILQSTTLAANASGGSGTYTYLWSSSPAGFSSTAATVTVSPIVNTVYTVVVDDGFNNTSASVPVIVNPLPIQYSMTGGGEYCTGGAGVIVGLSGSQAGVSYQLYNNGIATGLPIIGTGSSISFGNQTLSGIYTAVATRTATGCVENMTGSVSVTINPLPTANAGIDQTIPYGISTTLNGSVAGGTGPMSYSWTPLVNIASGLNTTTPNTTNLYSNTTFTFRVTDSKGCVGTDQVTIMLSGSAIAATATATPDEICADTSTSQLNALVTGGSGTYTYSWSSSPAGSPVWSSTLQNPVVSPDVTTTYTVVADDGFNTATASVTVIVDPLPLVFSVTGGGAYCFGTPGIAIGLSGSEPGVNYQLYRGGIPDGPPISGTGAPISFGNRMSAFTYTVLATNNTTGCINQMNGNAVVSILPPPNSYLVTGGGSYPLGGVGVKVGLSYGDPGVMYQLFCNSNPVGMPVLGLGATIDFGYQTLAGTYTVLATDMTTGCSANMNGSVSIVILPLPTVYNVYGGGVICQGDPGLMVSITGSELGIQYQLFKDGFPSGSPLVGNGFILSWGPFTSSGIYEVMAVNPVSGGTQMMNGQATITVNPVPTIFTMNPTGSQCPGTIIRLNGSDAGVTYYLRINGIVLDSLAGTGLVGFLDFGPQTINGTYTILAVNTATGCQALMNGTTYINVAPQVFNVIPAGILCPGQPIELSGSELGVSYQLRWNGTFDLGSPVPGTGGPITVGVGGLPGVYSIIGIDDTTNCVSYMQDSATLYPDPVIFTIIPNGVACEGDNVSLNGSELGVDYVLLLDNAIHVDTIHGTGGVLDFGAQLTAGTYTIIAISQTSYCITPMNGSALFNDSPVQYDVIPAGVLCMGNTIGLSGSQIGVSYQLILNGTLMVASPIAGTGGPISFGPQNAIGTYTIRAINDTTSCYSTMNGSAVLDPLPTVFQVTPTGNHCPGTPVGLNGSEMNYNYILVYNGIVHLDTIVGTGGAISFGPQFTAGNYTVLAYNAASFCETAMNGSSTIDLAPTAFNMTPAGINCSGAVIGLDNSEAGVTYQLRLNGTTNIGVPIPGTGAPISFGIQTATGTYTVIATSGNGCTATMNGSAVISPLPILFTITSNTPACSNTPIGLNGSELNVNYVLILNGTLHLDTIPGTGGSLSFGNQATVGNYTVLAYNTLTNCQALMNGSVSIINAPAVYKMTPAGILCVGATLGLDNSETGVDYQLMLNGTLNVGLPVAGTGSAISFGSQTAVGSYTVVAIGSNGCTATMNGAAVISPLPTLFTMTSNSPACSNTPIGLNGSELNVNYVLILNGTLNLDTVPGTGGSVSFGNQSITGSYTVLAYNTLTNCQATMNGNVSILLTPTAYNLTPAGILCVGASIGIDNSEIGVDYQLRLNGTTNIGAPVAGTGSALSFGSQTAVGTYTVIAISANGCTTVMNGAATISPLPVQFNVTPGGTICANSPIGLNGSELNVNYVLMLNGTIHVDTLAGTGGSLSFGNQPTTGTYTVIAYNVLTNCQSTMNGNITIIPSPTAYAMTPAGIACVGATVGLSNSEIGVSYQLLLNGVTNVGTPVAGTGSAISFGSQPAVGSYTVVATNAGACSTTMNGTVVINALPALFTIAPTGSSCTNSIISLNGSEVNVNYVLILNGTIHLDTVAGTGSAISFGPQPITGTYTVLAYNVTTNCQNTMVGSSVILATPLPFNMTPSSLACEGTAIGLENSELGVNYQLRLNGTTNIGTPVAGTGAAISFGAQSLLGTYTVIATAANSCTAVMNGSVVINPLPTLFTITPGGSACANSTIGLNGSELNINYVLVLDGTLYLDTIPGTGAAISFGTQPTTGVYTVIAYNTLTNCQSTMNGNVTLVATPTAFNLTPAGIQCVGTVIGLNNSELGINYQLRLNGTTNIGAPVAGTGAAISFGAQSLLGTYTVIATAANSCTAVMNGSVVINPMPTLFTITPGGSACTSTLIGLNGSELNVNYVLVLDGTLYLDTIPGTGSAISFGTQPTTGVYTVIAYNTLTNCQSTMNGNVTLVATPTAFNMTPAGIQCVGTVIGLNNSELGINYQLRLNGTTNIGAPVAGTGAAISFGAQSLLGTYTVIATAANSCTAVMNGSVVINPLPTLFTITPGGSACANSTIGLNGSELNVNYVLVLDGTLYLDTIPGTGAAISFGTQPTTGVYTVIAYNTLTNCQSTMNGNVTLVATPTAFNMTPAGIQCVGTVIGLNNSELGINYQLRLNGTTNIGAPVAGTGAAISFGAQSLLGTYTVIATAANSCTAVMNGSVVINPLPTLFTITPGGSACANSTIGLNGSELNINYVLVLDGTFYLDTIPGTGAAISFGTQPTTGVYTVIAYNTLTNCQSTMNGSVTLVAAPTAYTMTPAGIECIGAILGLNNSEIGVSYQLLLNNTSNVGSPVAGTGSAISFGAQTLPGTYTVVATAANGCTAVMNGSIVVNPLPTLFTVTPAGSHCVNTIIGLNGSELNVNYVLVLNGTLNLDTIPGNGSAIAFGPQSIPGTYTILAYNTSTNCQTLMNGSSIIKVAPLAYSMTPTGIACLGDALGLSNSEVGVSYQLRLNTVTNIGAPVAGTGSAISFGIPTLPGTYTVVATSANGCTALMNGSVVVNPLPIAFTITPTGANCVGSAIGLNGSELNVNYILILNGTLNIDTLPGTGSSISFGNQFTTGTYTILAINSTTGCEALMNDSSVIKVAPTVYNTTPAGIACVGSAIGLDNSEPGVSYQLRRNGTFNIGTPITGTGSAINFGVQTLPGLYTIEASSGNGCIAVMNGSVNLYPYPVPFTLMPSGSHCPGTILTLNGSEVGMNYILMRDGVFPMDTLAGTGSTLSFGAPLIPGTYTVVAYSTVASCTSNMFGSTIILVAPTAFNVTPAGISCIGSTIGLDNSEIGVNYQLVRNGTVNVGAPVAGTGSAITFGVATVTGLYSVVGISTINNCPTTMNGLVDIEPAPLSYTLFPQGSQCAGTSVTLNGSSVGIDYVLVIDGIFYADTLAGTGNALNFGPQSVTGVYTILAIGGSSSCQSLMSGSCTINPLPILFNVTPAGLICASAVVGLDGSESGVDYTLYVNGTSTGATLAGTGSPISFGLQTAGVYTVKATNPVTNCSVFMNGSASIDNLPVVNAGLDQSVCSDQPVNLNGTSSFAGTVTWNSSGNGTFSNPAILNPVYTLGSLDITAGSAELILNVTGSGACVSSTASDTLLVTITGAPVVNAGPDVEVCQGGDYSITGASASQYSSLQWSTSGTGNFTSLNSLVTTYIPSAADLAAGSVNLTLTVTGISPCLNVISDVLVMTFHPYLAASAGNDMTICAGTDATISTASATNYSTLSWSTTGSGSFVGGNTLTPTYSPSIFDIAAGSVKLILTANPISPCTLVIRDTMTVTIAPAPVVNAGADVSICEGTLVTTLDAAASNYSSVVWSTSGTGTFNSVNILQPVYTPSLADILSGSVILTLQANGNSPCGNVTDQKVVNITRQPLFFAGADTLICEGMTYSTVTAYASFCNNITWTSSGSGSFANGNSMVATYTPSAADILAGSVVLTLSVDALAPCTGTVTDSFVLTIHKAPTAFAGPDASICNTIPFALSAATASNFATVSWTTSGTGSFSNSAVVNPVYNPSTADMLAGSVTLTLHVNALTACNNVADSMVLSITQLPSVNAGTDTHICTMPYTITGTSASQVASILWTVSSGTGTLINANTLNPTFTPSALDIANGFAILTLTGTPLSPCPDPAVDSIVLTIDQTPVVNAGADDMNCLGAIYTVNDATALHYSSLQWTSTGTGTFLNATTLNPSYTPSAADLSTGSVTLTLTATNVGCGSVSDSKTITFIGMPVINAGPDLIICQNTNVTIGGASASSYSSISWSTSGTGTFANGNTVSPTYSPSAADIALGTVTLTLTGNAISPCTGNIADQLILTISRIPVISAGADDKVCSNESYDIADATAIDADSLQWTTSGTGTFTNLNSVVSTYIPSTADIANGSVVLTLTAYNSPCSSVSDSKVLTIVPAPSVNAGPNATICSSCTYTVIGASAPNANSVHWTTMGSGTFSNANVINPTYQPSAFDCSQGYVVLELTAYGNVPCAAISDTMTLFISSAPGVDFSWGPSCEGQPVSFQVNTTVTNTGAVASYHWDFGDGTLSGMMNPSHLYPATGHYTVTLTVIDTTGNSMTNIHQLYVSEPPVAFFAYTSPNCSNQPVMFTDLSHTLYGNIAQWVWNYGDGSPNDTIIFPNDPNRLHQYDTSGAFNATLIITNSFGCIASFTQSVDIIPAPVANFNFTSTCFGTNTQFNDLSTANGAGNVVGWWWDFGDPGTGAANFSNQQDPAHIFSIPGTYQVMLVARNFNNCTDTIVKAVTITPGEAVDFTHHHTCVNDLSYFAPDTSVMNVANFVSWVWDFGDGGYSYMQAPTHTYNNPGSYLVSLTVTDFGGCISTKTKTVVVNPLPVAQFNISQQHCKGLPVHFDDVSATYAGYIVSWTWDFGDGSQQTINFPLNPDTDHTYSTSGSYTVTLTITASDSCTAVLTQSIVIEPAPTANFEYDNNCQGSQVQFNDLSQTGGTGVVSNWLWNFGDPITGWNNTSTQQNPVHTYAATGNYIVSLQVQTANGCSSVVTQTVTIHPQPVVDFYTDAHCANSPVNFHPAPNVNSANVVTWFWNFGDGLTGNVQNPVHIYAIPGFYPVTLTITDINGCQNSITHTVHVYPLPTVVFGFTQPACTQSTIYFNSSASTTVGYIVKWVWNFGDGNSQTVLYPNNPDVVHQYANYGLYTVTLTVFTNDSCSNFQTKTLNVLQSPLANYDYVNACAGQPVAFNDLSQGAVSSWNWNFGDPNSGSANNSTFQNPQHIFSQSGSFQVILVVGSTNTCIDSIQKTVTVTPAPTVDFSYNNGCANDTVFFNSSTFVNVSNTSGWLWQFGDNSTSTDMNPGHIYASPGTYTVTLTITNLTGCTNTKTHQVLVGSSPNAQFGHSSPLCSGSAVMFDDISSTSSGTITSWVWDFGDGTQTTVNAPANPDISHVYAAGGVYNATLTIHTSTGCENSMTSTLVINSAPVASFSVDGSCEGQVTDFTDLSQPSGSAAIIGWSWNFGDPGSGINNTAAVPSPSHIYNSTGTYTVLLTVTNATGCPDTASQVLTIAPPPAVEFLHSQPTCDGSPVTFNVDPSIVVVSAVSTYDWDFGDGSAHSNLASPVHTFTGPGNFNVTLSITNTTGCDNSVTHPVTIHALPVAQFTSDVACSNNQTVFTDISYSPDGSDITGWHWDFGVASMAGDTSNLQNPTFGYPAAGTYNVSLTVTTENGCSHSVTLQVNVIPAPQAEYKYTAEPCHNGSVIFQDMSSSPQSTITGWYWEFTPGIYSTLRDPVHVFGFTDTTFNVKLVVTNGSGCTDTIIKPVYIPAGMEIAVNYTQTCFGETTWFNSSVLTPAGDSLISFTWNFGEPESGFSNISHLRNPSHTYGRPGPFVISLEATDIHNCTTTLYKSVEVASLPKASFAAAGGQCDSLVSFTDKTSGAAIDTWIWQYGDGTSDTLHAPVNPNVNHYYSFPGIYVVTLTTQSTGGCVSTISDTIRRTPCIASAFDNVDTLLCQKKTMHFVDQSTCQAPIASWTWDFGDNSVTTFTSPQSVIEHTYMEPGVYTVKLTISTDMVGGAVTATSSQPVAVNPAPKSDFTWKDVCIGATTPFTNATSPNGSTIRDYSWKFGDPSNTSANSTLRNPTYTYALAGSYNVNLVSSNTIGCYDTIVKTVAIYAPPQAKFTWANSCEGKPVYFNDNTDTASSQITTWNWYFSDEHSMLGASTKQNPSYDFSSAGIFNTKLVVVDKNGCADTTEQQVAINASPVAVFSYTENFDNVQGQIKISNGTINGTGFLWDFGNGSTSYEQEPVIKYERDGDYTIKLVTWNGQDCGDTTSLDYSFLFKGLYIPNAFAPEDTHAGVTVFKPAGLNIAKYYIEVLDRWGNQLWKSDKLDVKGSPTEGWDGTVNNNLLPAGVYMWRAKAVFRDGSYWDGQNIGNNTNMPQTLTGTVTLIR